MGHFGRIGSFAAMITAVTLVACGGDGRGSRGGDGGGSPPPSMGDGGVAPPVPGEDGGTTLPPGDAGGPIGSDASTPPPPPPGDATLVVRDSCPSFPACGGAPAGTWHYTGGCLEPDFAAVRERCPGASIDDAVATASVSVSIGAVEIVRSGTVRLSATVHLPAECTYGMCSLIESALRGAYDSVSCTAEGAGCACAIEGVDRVMDADSYTIEGSTIVTGGGDRYEFCVEGSTLRYRPLDEATSSVFELTRL